MGQYNNINCEYKVYQKCQIWRKKHYIRIDKLDNIKGNWKLKEMYDHQIVLRRWRDKNNEGRSIHDTW